MATPWFPRDQAQSGPLPDGAATDSTLQNIEQNTQQIEDALGNPGPLPLGGATEATQQQVLDGIGTDVGGTAPLLGSTGIRGLLRGLYELWWDVRSVVGSQRAIKVDVVQTVGGGGGGDASAANQVAAIAKLNDILLKIIAAPSTEAKQDAEIAAINAITAALGTPLDINLPSGISTEAKQDVIIAGLVAISGQLSGTLTVGGSVSVSNFPGTQPVSGTFWQTTQPVSAASLPLPTGASTEATLALILAKIISAPATEAKQDAIIAALAGTLTVGLPAGASTLAEQQTQTTSLGIMDDWDESDRAKVNPVVGQAGVAANAGTTSANTQRVVIVTDQTVIPARIDQTTPGVTNGVQVNAALPAGNNNIGDVDIASTPKSATANTPVILTATGNVSGLASNTARKAWGIQNLGTDVLYVLMGTGATTSVFHFALAPGGVNDDGRGASIMDDTYTGVVSVDGTSPRFVAFEL